MFKYEKESNCDVVPNTFGRYSISRDGDLYDNLENVLVRRVLVGGEVHYDVAVHGLHRPIPASLLVALTYKGISIPLDLLGGTKILFEDGRSENLDPKNLIWKFPDSGIEVPTFPGYYFIPSFTRYAINRSGEVVSLFNGDLKMVSQAETGYINIGLRRDDGRYVGSNIHRLLGLTFIPYDRHINQMVINHQDGVRGCINLDNMEWVTYSENSIHGQARTLGYVGPARQAGVFKMLANRGAAKSPDELPFSDIEVKDIHTGEITIHSSQLKAARFMGVSAGTVSLKLNQNAIYPVIEERFIIRRVGDDWPVWDETVEYNKGKEKPTLARNVETGEVLEFKSATEAVKKLGLSKKVVTVSLKRKDRRVIGGFVFRYKNEDDSW